MGVERVEDPSQVQGRALAGYRDSVPAKNEWYHIKRLYDFHIDHNSQEFEEEHKNVC